MVIFLIYRSFLSFSKNWIDVLIQGVRNILHIFVLLLLWCISVCYMVIYLHIKQQRTQGRVLWNTHFYWQFFCHNNLSHLYKLPSLKSSISITLVKISWIYHVNVLSFCSTDLALQFARYNIRMNRFSIPDIRTLNALRLIASVESETSDIRKKLTETLFDALWQHEKGKELTVLLLG